MHHIAAFLLIVSLAACASPSGGRYDDTSMSLSDKSLAQLIIYQPDMFGMMRSPNVEVDGNATCDLPAGSFISTTAMPNGNTTVKTSLWDTPGTSHLSFATQPGKRYYVRVQFERSIGQAFGLIGSVIDSATKDHDGPYIMTLVDEGTAKAQLSSLKQSLDCTQ